ncbi:MAG: hypothetical protein KJP19_00845, partial [Deltaproteobacteria bacterium]|nr:hypothetical protein [Deltaproteobacteria bacterium]
MKSNRQKYSFLEGFVILLSLFLLATFAGCGGGGGGGDESGEDLGDRDSAAAEIAKLEDFDTTWQVGKYYYTYAMRENIPDTFSEEIGTLLSLESVSGEMLTEKFTEEATYEKDTSICIYAYLIEQMDYGAAVPSLITWLETNIFNYVPRATDCVTHALKVLTDQYDIDNDFYTYSFDEILDTIARARAWQTTISSEPGYRSSEEPQPPVTPIADGRCHALFEIFGTDLNDNKVSSKINGNIFHGDFDDCDAIRGKEIAREADDLWYGELFSGDPDIYLYDSEDDVSLMQDCAGLVANDVFKIDIKFASGNAYHILLAAETFGEEISTQPVRISFTDGEKYVGVWQSGDKDVPHVFYIEERGGIAYIVTKDGTGRKREKELDFVMEGNEKVYVYPIEETDRNNVKDKMHFRYFTSELRLFKIIPENIHNYEADIKCSSFNKCPNRTTTNTAANIVYDDCNPDSDNGDEDDYV